MRGRSGSIQALAAALVVAALAAPIAAGATPSVVDRVILRPSQVGKGYVLQPHPGSRKLQGVTTIDLCGFAFPSEKLRTKRLQVNYVHGHAVPVSNQVVVYRAGGAREALREVAQAAARCSKRVVPNRYNGMKMTYKVRRFADPRLLPGYVAMRVSVAANSGGLAQTVYTIYQVRGNVLSGVYAYANTAAARLVALHAAVASAANLKHSS